jgi:hypothetical protein
MKHKIPEELIFSNFTNEKVAQEVQYNVESNIGKILSLADAMQTSRIIHDEPEVWRVWWQLGDIRVALHKIMPCDECFFHPHPWPSVIRCLKGGYTHRIGLYNGPKADVEALTPDHIQAFSDTLVPMTTTISAGDSYLMPDIRQFHQVSTSAVSYSLMIMGLPYFPGATRRFSRKVPDHNITLTQEQINDIMGVTKSYYGL